MGCIVSSLRDPITHKKKPWNIPEVSVFVPGFRVPKSVEYFQSLGDLLPKSMVENLANLRDRIVVMAGQESLMFAAEKKRSTDEGSNLGHLHQALADYLPVLLGLVNDENELQHKVQFAWTNQEDDSEATTMSNAWYEILSVLHLMAMTRFSQANLLLLPTLAVDGFYKGVSEDNQLLSINVLLEAAGYLDFAVRHVLLQLPPDLRANLPKDLTEEVLQSLCLQSLGQCVDIQLGIAMDSVIATLAVKRRLACEMAKYWKKAQEKITDLPLTNGWGSKHKVFVTKKHAEALAAAYYYHGMILDERSVEKCHGVAVSALETADDYLEASKKAGVAFNKAYNTRVGICWCPPPWGSMKHLTEKIQADKARMLHINPGSYHHQRKPSLPDFDLALQPDEYRLPLPDPSWDKEKERA